VNAGIHHLDTTFESKIRLDPNIHVVMFAASLNIPLYECNMSSLPTMKGINVITLGKAQVNVVEDVSISIIKGIQQRQSNVVFEVGLFSRQIGTVFPRSNPRHRLIYKYQNCLEKINFKYLKLENPQFCIF
jgi:hypothetical protein